jgi:hypothetical protein
MYIHDHRAFKMHGENGRKLLWLFVPPQETAVISSYVSPELTLGKKYIINIIILSLPGIEPQSSSECYFFNLGNP